MSLMLTIGKKLAKGEDAMTPLGRFVIVDNGVQLIWEFRRSVFWTLPNTPAEEAYGAMARKALEDVLVEMRSWAARAQSDLDLARAELATIDDARTDGG